MVLSAMYTISSSKTVSDAKSKKEDERERDRWGRGDTDFDINCVGIDIMIP
jgi:hypothetical protein